jgi:hypothetical protein
MFSYVCTTTSFGSVVFSSAVPETHDGLLLRSVGCIVLFVWLISHQPTVLFSQNKSATSNQPTVLFFQNKSAPATSHQPNEQAVYMFSYVCTTTSFGSVVFSSAVPETHDGLLVPVRRGLRYL